MLYIFYNKFCRRYSLFYKRNKFWLNIIILFFLIKIIAMPWTSHPYDFWTFVTTFEKKYMFDLGFFANWNKGNPLIGIWFVSYKIWLFLIQYLKIDNLAVPLLIFLFKFPLLIIDVVNTWLLYKISRKLKSSIHNSLRLATLYFLNPIVFYVLVIHGHYEILTIFSILLLSYGTLFSRTLPTSFGLALGFSIKYFVPATFLFIIAYNKNFKFLIKTFLFTTIFICVEYIHLFLQPELITSIFKSITNLSNLNSTLSNQVITISSKNLIAIIYKIFTGLQLSSVNGGLLFTFAQKIHFILLFIFIFHACFIFLKIKSKPFCSDKEFILHLLLFITYFLLLIPVPQNHYLVWVVPLLILANIYNKRVGDSLLISFSTTGFFLCIKGENGSAIFFADTMGNVPTFFNNLFFPNHFDPYLFIIILLILIIIFIFYTTKKNGLQYNNMRFESSLIFSIISIMIWIIIIANTFFYSGTNFNKQLTVARNMGLQKEVYIGTYNSIVKRQNNKCFSITFLNTAKGLNLNNLKTIYKNKKGTVKFIFLERHNFLQQVSIENINRCQVFTENIKKNELIVSSNCVNWEKSNEICLQAVETKFKVSLKTIIKITTDNILINTGNIKPK